jgi:hypothetical protein
MPRFLIVDDMDFILNADDTDDADFILNADDTDDADFMPSALIPFGI